MKGWTLEYVRDLTVEDYDEIIQWLRDEADRAQHGEGSVDMDAMLAARRETPEGD
jgi:hypothetical protein